MTILPPPLPPSHLFASYTTDENRSIEVAGKSGEAIDRAMVKRLQTLGRGLFKIY